jgi:hypothetical protein
MVPELFAAHPRESSLVNSQQVLPGAKVAFEAQALRNLVGGDDVAFDHLVSLIQSLRDQPILLPGFETLRRTSIIGTIIIFGLMFTTFPS